MTIPAAVLSVPEDPNPGAPHKLSPKEKRF